MKCSIPEFHSLNMWSIISSFLIARRSLAQETHNPGHDWNFLVLLFSLIGRKLAWQFLQEHWDVFYNRYSSGVIFSRLIEVRRCIDALRLFYVIKRSNSLVNGKRLI